MSDTSLAHSRTNETPIEREVARRRTFAIISHPDAGKTTLTEKLLLFGGAINLAGEVKAKKNRINDAVIGCSSEKPTVSKITDESKE